MSENPGLISVLELKRLISELQEKRPDICIRFRLLGEMWTVSFMHVISVTDNGVLLKDTYKDSIITIHDLSHVMQFEIDNGFQDFQPHFHYEVRPLPHFK